MWIPSRTGTLVSCLALAAGFSDAEAGARGQRLVARDPFISELMQHGHAMAPDSAKAALSNIHRTAKTHLDNSWMRSSKPVDKATAKADMGSMMGKLKSDKLDKPHERKTVKECPRACAAQFVRQPLPRAEVERHRRWAGGMARWCRGAPA